MTVTVLHRHFIDFDDFLVELVKDRNPTGLPLLTEAAAMISAYLTAERDLDRIAADADIGDGVHSADALQRRGRGGDARHVAPVDRHAGSVPA